MLHHPVEDLTLLYTQLSIFRLDPPPDLSISVEWELQEAELTGTYLTSCVFPKDWHLVGAQAYLRLHG